MSDHDTRVGNSARTSFGGWRSQDIASAPHGAQRVDRTRCGGDRDGSWIALPIVTSLFADEYPVTDTIVMPIIGLVLTVLAAVVNVLVLWLARQRSLANILATVLTVSATLFFGFFVIGEGLGGA